MILNETETTTTSVNFGHTIQIQTNYTQNKTNHYTYQLTITNSEKQILYTEIYNKPYWLKTMKINQIIKEIIKHYKFPITEPGNEKFEPITKKETIKYLKQTIYEIGDKIQRQITEKEQQTQLETEKASQEDEIHELTKEEREKALQLAQKPNLIELIEKTLDKNIVGEKTNKILIYLTAITIKLKNEKINLQITGDSSGGKSHTVNQVLRLFPPENVLDYSRITKTSLDRLENIDLDNKIMFIGEGSGAETAIDSIKMITDGIHGKRKLLTNIKDERGNYTTKEIITQGQPVFITTTAKIIEDQEFA